MNNKAKGSRWELSIKKMLENTGYQCTKAGGSLGVFDLVCFRKNEVRLIQAKCNYCPPTEIETIKEFPLDKEIKTQKEVWIKKDRIKEPIIKIY